MKQYLELLELILNRGKKRDDRTGVGTLSVFSPPDLHFSLRDHQLPLITTKTVRFDKVAHELIWFLRGESRVDYLREHKVKIWEPWTPGSGDLGPVYGYQWRRWPSANGGIDQISDLVQRLRSDPDSRRHIVSAWNVADLPKMALPPCHLLFECYVMEGELSLKMIQRSADVFIGLPFNIASYATLTHLLAKVTGLRAAELAVDLNDAHLYLNHLEQVKEQLGRKPRPLPKLWINPALTDLDRLSIEDLRVEGYDPYPAIKAPVAV